jgi:hypothetical protein
VASIGNGMDPALPTVRAISALEPTPTKNGCHQHENSNCRDACGFLAVHHVVAWEFGYTSVFEVAFREHPTTQAVIDLWISCGLLFMIMIVDNRRSGRRPRAVAPYALITMLLGAIGPLLYFIVYPGLLTIKGRAASAHE